MLIRSTVRDGHVRSLLGSPFGIIGQSVLKGLSGRNRLVSERRQAPGRNTPMAFRLVRWNENRRPHFMVSLTCLPAGITVEGATPRGGLTVNCEVKRLTRPDAAPAVKNGGSLPPPTPLPCGAPTRRARGGHARRRLASRSRMGRGKSVLSRVPCDVWEKSWTTTGRPPPSEREALWLSKT